jgi:hypothetical protein
VGTSAACAGILLGACSLAVSTSGLSGGVDPTSSSEGGGGDAGADGYSFPKSSTQQRSIFDLYENGRSHLFIRRADGATGSHFQFAAQSSASTTSYAFAGNFDTEPNVWTHLVFTWDAVRSEAAFYVGGVLVKKDGYGLTFSLEGQLFRIGEGMIGGFDEVRLFDRVLSPDEAGKLD